MQKINKISRQKLLLLSLCLVLALAALCGCGGDDKQQGQTTALQGTGIAWQNVDDVEGLAWAVNEQNGDSVLQVPLFADADSSDALVKLNAGLQERADYWQAWLADNAETENFITVKPLVMETENYLSVILYEDEAPTYGSDGKVNAFVWDKLTDSAMDEDLAWALAGATDEDVAAALVQYIADNMNVEGTDFRWQEFVTQGYFVDADGKAALILDTLITDKTPDGADDWQHLLIYKDGKIVGKLIEDIRTEN